MATISKEDQRQVVLKSLSELMEMVKKDDILSLEYDLTNDIVELRPRWDDEVKPLAETGEIRIVLTLVLIDKDKREKYIEEIGRR